MFYGAEAGLNLVSRPRGRPLRGKIMLGKIFLASLTPASP
jgi:hypothetical protein